MEISLRSDNTRWAVPESEPEYVQRSEKVRTRKWQIYDVIASFFAGLAVVLVFWFSILVLDRGVPGERLWLLNLVIFWAVVAYLAFPRLHQIVSTIYVPNYFIGRTRTAEGILGDPVNLAFNGDESDMHEVMRQAGWVQADPLTARTAWNIVVASVLRKSYPSAPVSHLYLFGRQEDFAYEREVNGNPARRHHVRFWKTPEGWSLPGGIAVDWLAAATYDRSVGLSLFTGQVTHKIDAHIDLERDYLIGTILYGSPGVRVGVIDRYFNAYHSRNGGGDTIRTDGDLPVLSVTEDRQEIAADRAHGGESVQEQAKPAGTDVQTATQTRAKGHELPPALIWFVGLLTIARELSNIAMDDFTFATASLSILVNVGLLALIVLRQRWAWVAMLVIQSMAAITFLILAFSEEQWPLLDAGFSVLLVFALSATSVRLWVSQGRKERYFRQLWPRRRR